MLIRTVGGESWTGCRGRAGVGRAVFSRAGCTSRGSGGPAPCGSAAARPSGGRALVRSRLCAPLALHCKSRSVDDATKEDPCLTGKHHKSSCHGHGSDGTQSQHVNIRRWQKIHKQILER